MTFLVAGLALGWLQNPAEGTELTWAEEKCRRYENAWNEVLSRWGTDGMSAGFIDGNKAFIAGGCTGQGNVCPRSSRDLELANILTIAAMNAGTASTFLPFACRDE